MDSVIVTALPYCHVLPLSLYGLVGQGIRVARDPTVDVGSRVEWRTATTPEEEMETETSEQVR